MKHLRKQIAGYLLTLILLMAGIVFPGSGEKVLASGGSMTVHFLDVGQGLSILVQSEGQNLLYDGPAMWCPICRSRMCQKLII